MANKPEVLVFYKAVVDPRSCKLDLTHPFDKPVGALFNTTARKDEIDPNTGEVLKSYQPRPMSLKEALASKSPTYQPLDKVRVEIGFSIHTELPSSIILRVNIDPEHCSSFEDHRSIRDVFTFRVKLYASNVTHMTAESIQVAFPSDKPEGVVADIPMIVTQTPKIQEFKDTIWHMNLHVDNTAGTINSEHLMNTLTFEHAPSQRALVIFRALFGAAHQISVPVYVRDEQAAGFREHYDKVLAQFAYERKTGNIFRHYYSQNLQLTDAPHHINSGALCQPAIRPTMTTRAQPSYSTVFELTTRLGVPLVEALEDRRAKVEDMNIYGGFVRVMEILGAGDTGYFAFLSFPLDAENTIRLEVGDRVDLNFRIQNTLSEENWAARVIEPFVWCLQGEIVLFLSRPREPLPFNATRQQRMAFRGFQKTKLPVSKMTATTIEEARSFLEGVTPIHCIVNFRSSEKSETRLLEGLESANLGSRVVKGLKGPVRMDSQLIAKWANFVTMKDARVYDSRDLFPSDKAQEYLNKLTDKDHRECIAYLRNCPVGNAGTAVGVISGIAGGGKSFLAAEIIVATLIGSPGARVLVVASANQPCDVLLTKVKRCLEKAKETPALAQILGAKTAVRVHADASESSYVISLLETDYKSRPVDTEGEAEIMPGRAADEAENMQERADDASEPKLVSDLVAPGEGVTEVDDSDDSNDEEDEGNKDDEDEGYDDEKGAKGKGKKKRISRKKRLHLAIAEGRRIHADYLVNNQGDAIIISEEDLIGEMNKLQFYGPLLENNVVDIHHTSVPKELLSGIPLDMVLALNQQLKPAVSGVRDKRYVNPEQGTGLHALQLAESDRNLTDARLLFEKFRTEGPTMTQEDQDTMNNNLRLLMHTVKGTGSVLGMTVNSLGIPTNRDSVGAFDLVIFDEAGKADLADFHLLFASVAFHNIILIGDINQLSPTGTGIIGGCHADLQQSILTYLYDNHWPQAELFLQRRGVAGIFDVPSVVFYGGKVEDASCALVKDIHKLTQPFLELMTSLFPSCISDKPYRFINIQGYEEAQDSITGSWYNLSSASVIVTIIEKAIREGIVKAKDVPVITHYTAQQKVYRHAFAKLDQEFPGLGFSDINDHTTDTFQGGEGPVVFADPVRTSRLGFTKNRGRNCVMVTRASDFLVVVGNMSINNGSDKIPYMKKCFQVARKFKSCVDLKARVEEEKVYFHHRYVHARVLGTKENAEAIKQQEYTFDPEPQDNQQSGSWDSSEANQQENTLDSEQQDNQQPESWDSVEAATAWGENQTDLPQTANENTTGYTGACRDFLIQQDFLLQNTFLEQLPLDYDSDAEADKIEAGTEPYSSKIGFRTCEEIFKNAINNRTNSKAAIKNHVPQAKAPSTQQAKIRVLVIFKAFMKSLQVPDDTIPNGDHLYRFVHTISKTIQPRSFNKEVPSVRTIHGLLYTLKSVLTEIYEGFQITSSKAKRIDSLLIKLVKDGALTAGRWKKPNRVGFQTLITLTEGWMNTALTNGVIAWDTIISRQLSIVLTASFAARAGDVVRSHLYEDMECCLFRDLTLSFRGGDDIEHLSMNVCLRFVKGFKALPNEDRNLRLDILAYPAHNSVCPVKLLIIHALRIGAVDSTTFHELRTKAIARADKTVQWCTPENPVIPAITPSRIFLDLKRPAGVQQTIKTINAMSIKAKCTVQLRTHDLRHGTARDLAHLNHGSIRGHANMTVASAMGHKMSAFMRDVTDKYVGGSDVSSWTLRAQSEWRDSSAPRMGNTAFVAPTLRPGELEDYCKEKGWDPALPSKIYTARSHIRQRQLAEWRAQLQDEPSEVITSVPARPVLQPLKDIISSRGTNANITSKQHIAAKDPSTLLIDPQILAGSSPAVPMCLTQSLEQTLSIRATLPSSTSLPRMFDSSDMNIPDDEDMDTDIHDDESVPLSANDQENAVRLLNVMLEKSELIDSVSDEDEDLALLDALDAAAQSYDDMDPVHSSAKGFIEYFARINILRITVPSKFSEAKFQQEMERWAPIGNSRDKPMRFILYCSNKKWGCEYSNPSHSHMQRHIPKCKISSSNLVSTTSFTCGKPKCGKQFGSRSGLMSHERDHNFEKRQCDLCHDGRWYEKERSWNHHNSEYHTNNWDLDTTCSVPDCFRRDKPFPSRNAYQQHLRTVHRLSGSDVTQYLPALPQQAPAWGSRKRKCPFDDCARELVQKNSMKNHLMSSTHKLSTEEAAAKIKEMMARQG
ncbi:hypothetical protein B7494_g1722 [Chlorociboria aeruginascens]|nr:hypothetical protein B7494_g1722 [Chlorociboria aeruginascens]